MSSYNPDTNPFDFKMSNLPQFGADIERQALANVADDIDFAKRMLLQHKVKSFTAADVIEVARMIQQQRAALEANRGKGA